MENCEEIFPEHRDLTIAGTMTCPNCREKVWMVLPSQAVQAYMAGALIQEAFPFMPAQQRERLGSGICPPCWEVLFPTEFENDPF